MRSLLLSLAVAAALAGCHGGTGFEACFDGFDNDGDGAVDCDDFECMADVGCVGGDSDTTDTTDTTETDEPPLFETNCTDGIDEDEDGQTDCVDPDCAATSACRQDEACGDGKDNDKDGAVDCQDSDCTNEPACEREVCSDGIDNDGDQAVDCLDSDCSSLPLCQVPDEICTDAKDNDKDGFVDCQDSDCVAASACKATEICTDAKDNDGDLAVDCADSDCSATPACKVEACGNGLDDDGDLLVDCDDSDCAGGPSCDELLFFMEIGKATMSGTTSLSGTATTGWEVYPLSTTSLMVPSKRLCEYRSNINGTPYAGANAAGCVGCTWRLDVAFTGTTGPTGTDCVLWEPSFSPSGSVYAYGYDPDYNGYAALMYESNTGWKLGTYYVGLSGSTLQYAWPFVWSYY